MNVRLSAVILVFVVAFLAAPFTVNALNETEVLRGLDEQIEQQKKNIQKAEQTLETAAEKANAPATNEAQAILDAAKGLLESLMKQKEQVSAPLTDANKMCTPVIKQCGCGQVLRCGLGGCRCIGGANMWQCKCFQKIPNNTGQIVNGTCIDTEKCEGIDYTNLEGKSAGVGDIGGIVGNIFKGLLDKLMGGGGGGGGGGSPSGGASSSGCTQYYQVTVPSTDPCAQYVPPTSSSLLDTDAEQNNASTDLLNALQGGTQSSLDTNLGTESEEDTATESTNVSDTILNFIRTSQSSASTQGTSSTTSLPFSSTLGSQAVNLQPGTQGNIVVTGTGATVVANSRDTQTNSEVAGFYGSDTLGNAQPQGVAARMCESRPWAGSVVSFVIPPAFFDSLCAWRGYQVGTPQAAPSPQPQTPTGITPQTTPQVATPSPVPVSTVPPSVDIWATPSTVTLGARTSIFWNAKGVVSCEETSPSGSFYQNTFSGGASTVSLSSPTTFVISCITPDGTTVTDSVTVNLAI